MLGGCAPPGDSPPVGCNGSVVVRSLVGDIPSGSSPPDEDGVVKGGA